MAPQEHHIGVVSWAKAPRAYKGMDGGILFSAPSEVELLDIARKGTWRDEELSHFDPMTFRLLRVSPLDVPVRDGTQQLLGYDVGHINSCDSVYSLIIHYLFNNRPAGQTVSGLNSDLLFEEAVDAQRLLDEWQTWKPADRGAKEGFAADDVLQPYAIFLDTGPSTAPPQWKWP